MMKFKSFMTMTMVAMAFVLSVCSCSSDDDDPVVALADQVAKEYSGKEVVMVMGEESSNDTKTYSFAKASESSINMTIPEMGMGGHMSIPALQVKNIPLTKKDNTIGGALASYTGSVTNADGSEKAFTITGFSAAFFNTLFFMSLLVLLFGSTEYLQNLMAGRGVLTFIIASVGINAVVEMIVAAVVTAAVGIALKKSKLI